jgi:hypothetical protein
MPDGQRIFSADAAQALWTPQTLIPIGPAPAAIALAAPQFSAYALGLEVTDYRGHKIVTHLGGVLGAISAVVIIPERQVAFAILLNSEDAGTLFAMREHLLDMALGLDSPDWIAAYQQVLAARYVKATQALQAATQPARTAAGPSLPLAAYAGVYRDPWYGTVTISAPANGKAGGLRIRFDRSPGMQGALEHTQYDSFRTRFQTPGLEDAYVTFALTPRGAIERMTMQAVSPLADFSYDYQDLRFTPVAAPRAGAQ